MSARTSAFVARVARASIWAPGAIPRSEGKIARDMKRIIFPLLDVALFLMGFLGAIHTVPALNETLPDDRVDTICAMFAATAVGAFVGVSFPRLAFLEFVSKVALCAALAGFMLALVFVAVGATNTPGGDSRWYVLPMFAFVFCLVLWRAVALSVEWGHRRAKNRRWKKAR